MNKKLPVWLPGVLGCVFGILLTFSGFITAPWVSQSAYAKIFFFAPSLISHSIGETSYDRLEDFFCPLPPELAGTAFSGSCDDRVIFYFLLLSNILIYGSLVQIIWMVYKGISKHVRFQAQKTL
ncbi:MAG: hypothetical protein WC641_05235 [Patescibacteria group bacterium]